MCDHFGGCHTDDFVVSLERSFELDKHSFGDDQSDFWYFGIDNRN